MSQYNTGTVTVSSGSQDVYGSWAGTLTSYQGPFQVGDPLTFPASSATGEVLSWNDGSGALGFFITSSQQPSTGELVTSTGTLSGTLSLINQEPAFLGNIDAGDLFIVGSPGVSYEVGSVQTKSHFRIASEFAQASVSDSSYVVSNSFTPNFGFAYAEAGDQKPAEVIKRGIIAIDEALQNPSVSGLSAVDGDFSNSITISALTANRNVVTSTSGLLSVLGGTREVLTANRTYYVRTDGSDSNDGLTNSSGGAFATIQKAVNVIGGLDLYTFTVTIQLGTTGTYSDVVVIDGPWGGGPGSGVVLSGDTGSPADYVVSSAAGNTLTVLNGGALSVQGIEVAGTGSALLCRDGGTIRITGNMDFGTSGSHISAYLGGIVKIEADYSLTAGADRHYDLRGGSIACIGSRTITSSGSFGFAAAEFIGAQGSGAYGDFQGATFTGGTITGTRWRASLNGAINTGGVGADTMFPGDANGSASTGGQTA